jgi:hypothetical protein
MMETGITSPLSSTVLRVWFVRLMGACQARYSLSALSGQSINNTRQIHIGARDQAGDEIFFNGIIDDVRIYSVALDQA